MNWKSWSYCITCGDIHPLIRLCLHNLVVSKICPVALWEECFNMGRTFFKDRCNLDGITYYERMFSPIEGLIYIRIMEHKWIDAA